MTKLKHAIRNSIILLLVVLLTSFSLSCNYSTKGCTYTTEGTDPTFLTSLSDQVVDNNYSNMSYDEINKIYKSLKLRYSKNREDYDSDIIFANFRNVKVGNIKDRILYRGASPINNSYGRAKYVDKLLKEHNIKYDINLSDNDKSINRYFDKSDFDSYYFESLYDNGKVLRLHMNTNYREKKYQERVVQAMVAMANNEGPYYIHCVEGKNRTGFVLLVIEGLAGASYEEMLNDFMITFDNYYGININNDREKYEIIKARYVDSMLRYLAGDSNKDIELKDLDYTNIMGRFLVENGMSLEDIDKWYKNLTNNAS